MNRVQIIESLERRTYFSPLSFSAPISFPTGNKPSDIVAADLSNNGDIDVVTSDLDAANIAVLMGNGNGTFQAPVFYPVGSAPQALAVGDFNGDGIPDIVTANEQGNSVSVLIGNGDGTFLPAVNYSVGIRPITIAVADLRNNGQMDIVVANEGSSTVSVLLNNGDGTFAPAVSYFVGNQPDGVALADVNGDELTDIVTVNPVNNNAHVLLNQGDGTFGQLGTYATDLAGRAVAIADLNSDGRPDIVTANLHSTDISLLEGDGNGIFQAAENFGTGVFPFSIAIADVNGDGRPDVITADNFDNAVGVLLRTGTGAFTVVKQFKAGDGPVAAVAADVNGDGRDDILVADFNTSTISVLLNQTVFVPLLPTSTTLSLNQNPVEFHNHLVLSAQITPVTEGAKKPVGVVQFFAGDDVLGIGILNAAGLARISVKTLPIGTYTITAHYGGDSIYAGSFTAAATESVIPAATATPFLSPSISAVHLPDAYVPGDRGIADVLINNAGPGTADGVVSVQLYASASTTFDSTAFALSSALVRINLPGGLSKLTAIGFTMPVSIGPGNYTIFAALAPVTVLTQAQVSTTPAVGLTTQQAVLQFGTVADHTNYRLTRTLADGTVVTFALTGPGTGCVTENADGGISIGVAGTTAGSTVSITSNGPVTLDSMTATSPIGTVDAPALNLAGALSLNGSVRRLTLGNATDGSIFLAFGVPNIISLGNVSNTSIYCAAPIHSLTVASYYNQPDDAITTAWITDLRCTGNFGGDLYINGGTGSRDISMQSAVIGGTLLDSIWSIQANVARIQTAGIAAGWSGSIHGLLSNLLVTGDFAGQLAAHNIGTIQIDGNLTDAAILAGADFGTSARLSATGNNFTYGILDSLKVLGDATNSVVAAGLVPAAGALLAPGSTLLPRSAVKSIIIAGTVDSATRFLAVSLPVNASIDGNTIATAGDVNFGS